MTVHATQKRLDTGTDLNAQRGWSFPLALFATAVILASLRLLSLQSTSVSQLIRTVRAGERAHQERIRATANAISVQRGCQTIAGSSQSTLSTTTVCSDGLSSSFSTPDMVLPAQRIDFEGLFAQSTRCPGTTKSSVRSVSIIPMASRDCVLPPTIVGGATLLENVWGDFMRIAPATTTAALLASPGTVTIRGALVTEQDLLVVAGGTVEIGTITSNRISPTRVTVVSSLGDIRIGSLTGDIALLLIGRGTRAGPATPLRPPYPLPPMKNLSLFGFAPSS